MSCLTCVCDCTRSTCRLFPPFLSWATFSRVANPLTRNLCHLVIASLLTNVPPRLAALGADFCDFAGQTPPSPAVRSLFQQLMALLRPALAPHAGDLWKAERSVIATLIAADMRGASAAGESREGGFAFMTDEWAATLFSRAARGRAWDSFECSLGSITADTDRIRDGESGLDDSHLSGRMPRTAILAGDTGGVGGASFYNKGGSGATGYGDDAAITQRVGVPGQAVGASDFSDDFEHDGASISDGWSSNAGSDAGSDEAVAIATVWALHAPPSASPNASSDTLRASTSGGIG